MKIEQVRTAIGAILYGMVWDGNQPTGIDKDEALDYAAELAMWAQELIDDHTHQIELDTRGFTIQHPMAERLNGTLFDCDIWWDEEDPGIRGRFYLLDNGILGDRIE